MNNIRSIDQDLVKCAVKKNHGPAPLMQWLAISDLCVDDNYQRAITQSGKNAVRKIAQNFNWSYFTTLLVAPVEGGKFAIIDGQHRAHAAAICGIKEVPCQIVQADAMTQATAFAAVNGAVQNITILQVYKAALYSGESWALAVKRVADGAGVTVRTTNVSCTFRQSGDTAAVGGLRKMIGKHGEKIVGLALRVLMHEPYNGRPEDLSRRNICALCEALGARPHWLKYQDDLFASFANEILHLDELYESVSRKRIQSRVLGNLPEPADVMLADEIIIGMDSVKKAQIALPGNMMVRADR